MYRWLADDAFWRIYDRVGNDDPKWDQIRSKFIDVWSDMYYWLTAYHNNR